MSVRYHLGKFPPPSLRWEELIPLLGPASAALARYDGLLQAIPNPQVLLAPLTTQEAVLSSRIEGTQATASEVFEFEADEARFTGERRDDIREVLNYRRALSFAVTKLAELPLSLRLLLDSHRLLMSGVRGASKAPGEYRRIQNWIGAPGCTEETARFIPIAPQLLPEAMGALENYIHSDEPDKLVQLAVVHAEFEALHPFLDGNGRLGRMIIPLFLVEKRLLSSPNFFVSAYFDQDRQSYYDALLSVSAGGDWTPWCRYFLQALSTQALDNEKRARSILDLYQADEGADRRSHPFPARHPGTRFHLPVPDLYRPVVRAALGYPDSHGPEDPPPAARRRDSSHRSGALRPQPRNFLLPRSTSPGGRRL